ncbi:MAG: type II toxin-antitoxin system RatA family toxin [Caulobacter sp.]|nr:type II toxin-antitoxin system RatA family toxin [Caulobacter sp.]
MRHALTRILPYAPELLFELVGDVERYPQFVPWVTGMRVWNRRELEPDVSQLDAEASVAFSFLREKFATRVRRDAGRRTIAVDLLYGPFRRLSNRWRFEPHPEGCEVSFEIDFEFKAPFLDRILAANFEPAVARLMTCFEDRAAALSKAGPSPQAGRS